MVTESTTTKPDINLDVRPVEPKNRLDSIMGAWKQLDIGQALHLTVDHDPQCMYYTLKADYGDEAFQFDRLVSGPTNWEVRVTRRK